MDAQVRATARYRKRTKSKGLVRVEATVLSTDAALLKEVVKALRGENAQQVRAAVTNALNSKPKTLLDYLASDLPDEDFEGIFDHSRDHDSRDLDLS